MDIGFSPNYTNVYFIDTTPDAASPTWAYLGPGIATVDTDDEDTTDDTAYYDGGGAQAEDVTGVKIGYSFSGNRRFGDPAQDFIVSLRAQTGEGRRTRLRHVAPDGEIVEGVVTVKDISVGGGDANDKGNFEFSVTFIGLPAFSDPTATELPETVDAKAVTVKAGSAAQVEPTVTPADASSQCLYAVEDDTVAKVDAAGNVTGVKAGKTRVSVKCAARPSVVTVVDVTVSAAA